MASPRVSARPADLGNLWGDFFQIALGGVDVPFVVYD